MKRLTERDSFGNADIIGVESADLQLNLEFDEFNKVTEALNRLASYEDSELSPEDFIKLVDSKANEHENIELRKEIAKVNLYHYKLTEVIARNLVAWDTSKDKSHGLLPEIYLTNKVIYRELTGEEYEFNKACKRFHKEVFI